MLEVGKLSTAQTRRSDALIFGQRNVRFGCICADCCVWRHQNQGHMGRCWNHGSSGSVCLMPLSFLCCKSGYCLAFEHRRGLVHLRRTWIGGAVLYLILMMIQGQSQVDLGSLIVLITGLGAMIL